MPDAAETVTRVVLRGGLTFRVLASGADPGASHPPIVLVHGIGMSHRYLARLHRVFAGAGPVFSIDLPGYAGLPKPVSDLGVEAMGQALGEVIASLGVGAVVLVGHSMGAQWVTAAGVRHPESVSHVVVIGPVADARHRSIAAQMRALAVDTLGESPLANALVFTDYVRCGVPYYLAQVRHLLTYPLEDRVAQLSMPLLVIRGERDPIAGLDWCRMLRDRAHEATLVTIPGQYHVVQHSAPKAVASAIDAYTMDADGERDDQPAEFPSPPR